MNASGFSAYFDRIIGKILWKLMFSSIDRESCFAERGKASLQSPAFTGEQDEINRWIRNDLLPGS